MLRIAIVGRAIKKKTKNTKSNKEKTLEKSPTSYKNIKEW